MNYDGYQFISLHGFNNPDQGADDLDLMHEAIGAPVYELNRDWEGLVEARLELRKEARRLVETIREFHEREVVLLGHSHGCNIIREGLTSVDVSEMVRACILFNPAVRRDASFQKVPTLCFHSKGDRAVMAARMLWWFPWNVLWKHPWGPAGNRGLEPLPGHIRVNVDEERLTGEEIGHSGIFKTKERREAAAKKIEEFLLSL